MISPVWLRGFFYLGLGTRPRCGCISCCQNFSVKQQSHDGSRIIIVEEKSSFSWPWISFLLPAFGILQYRYLQKCFLTFELTGTPANWRILGTCQSSLAINIWYFRSQFIPKARAIYWLEGDIVYVGIHWIFSTSFRYHCFWFLRAKKRASWRTK